MTWPGGRRTMEETADAPAVADGAVAATVPRLTGDPPDSDIDERSSRGNASSTGVSRRSERCVPERRSARRTNAYTRIMRRRFTNPFTPLLGATGVVFTVTAASYCLSVLRGTRGMDPDVPPHPLQSLMDTHGTAILVGQLVLLAVATFGSIAIDHAEGAKIRREREAIDGAAGKAGRTAPSSAVRPLDGTRTVVAERGENA